MKLAKFSLLTAATTLGLLLNPASFPATTALGGYEENQYLTRTPAYMEQMFPQLDEGIIIILILITPLGIAFGLSQISPLISNRKNYLCSFLRRIFSILS